MKAYLEAKRTVDDRALNRRVLERFQTELPDTDPVRIVELGVGVGTMITRLAAWGLLPERVSYRAVDHDRKTIERAQSLVPAELETLGYDVSQSTTADANTETLIADHSEDRTRLEITLEQADALTLEATADVVIAAAFLDLVDADAAVPALEAMLEDGGLLYAPITYDGGTGFAPRDPLDSHLEQAYHRHMDEHRDGGRSDAGRHLLTELPARDWTVLESGGSNWIVRPSADNGYPDAERVVVEHVLETIDDAVAEVVSTQETDAIPARDRQRWLERRLDELERGDLVYTVTNLDVLARR
ncbi:hypothetical protein [Natronolimnobius baerhuensis]|uniref:SAM-dependent methyltransferase n=1 Tax=Natronolimnobius baerhuensis TaxID=253108 RepID=A0A202EDD3_9EURY|nr:hypothetical protein [Natronolimnobius baerhuensis]OVE86254.1 hypothetical protein B2G88_05580 [Natronolimnobius baerhuensis]